MDRDYERKKAIENLNTINEELPNLNEVFKEKGVDSFNYHSKPATKIGKASGNPSAWNKTAFNEAEKYYNILESDRYAQYRGDKEMGKLLDKTKENLKEVRITLRSLESRTNLNKSLAILSIGSIFAGIFFLSPNLTGNVIGNIAKNSGNILGGILFILGIVGAFFTFKK